MKSIIYIIVISLFATIGCNKPDVAKGTPRCIKEKTKDFEKDACDKGASVKEYKFQGASVYVFDHGTCGADQTSAVLNEDCKTLGYLGGITGNTTINNGDFASATFVKIIWEN